MAGVITAMAAGSACAGAADAGHAVQTADDNAIQLQQFTVIANKVDSANIGQSTLNKQQIEQQQATTVQELVDTLPGTSLSGSPRIGGQSINIWGFGSMDEEDVQMRLDGAPKFFQKYMQGSLYVEPELLKAIEVSKGPHSAFYGNGGFGGVINMETKDADDLLKPGQTTGALVKAGYHSNNNMALYSTSAYTGGEDNPFDLVVNMTHRDSDNMKTGGDDTFHYSGINANAGLFKLGYDFNNGHRVKLTRIINRDDSRVPWSAKSGLFSPADFYDGNLYRRTVRRKTDDKTTLLKHEYSSPVHDWLNTSLTLSQATTKQHDTRPKEASKYSGSNMGNESWTDYKSLFAEFKNTQDLFFDHSEHTLTYGVQFQRGKRDVKMIDLSKKGKDEYNNGYYQPWYMPSGTQTTWSAFFQDEIAIDRLTITPSLRFDQVLNEGKPNVASRFNQPSAGHDYRSKRYQGFSPRLGLYYRLNADTALFGDISHTFRAPSVDDVYTTQSKYATASATSRNLKPETINAVRFGFVRSISDLFVPGDNLLVRTTLFHQQVKNSIERRLGEYFDKDANGDKLSNQSNYINHAGFYVRGVEAELFYDAERVFASLNGSAMDSRYDGTPRDPNGRDVPVNEVPPPEANMTLGYKWLEQDIHLGWKGKYVHKSDRNARDLDPMGKHYALYPESKSYMLHGLFMTWQPKSDNLDGLKVVVSVDNLTDKYYRPYLSEAVPGMGRNIKTTVSYQF